MAQVLTASPAQQQVLYQQARAFEAAASRVSIAVAARYQFWRSLKESAARANLSLSDAFSADVVAANDRADRNAVRWATAVVALNGRRAELAGWTPDNGATIKLGVVVAGTLPLPLQAWPIVPILYYGAIGLASLGTWLLADAWLDAEAIEADARRTHAETQRQATEAVAKASLLGPQYGQMVADAIAQANASSKAPPAGVLSSLAEAIASAAEGVKETMKSAGGLGGAVLLLAALFAWGKRERGRA